MIPSRNVRTAQGRKVFAKVRRKRYIYRDKVSKVLCYAMGKVDVCRGPRERRRYGQIRGKNVLVEVYRKKCHVWLKGKR